MVEQRAAIQHLFFYEVRYPVPELDSDAFDVIKGHSEYFVRSWRYFGFWGISGLVYESSKLGYTSPVRSNAPFFVCCVYFRLSLSGLSYSLLQRTLQVSEC